MSSQVQNELSANGMPVYQQPDPSLLTQFENLYDVNFTQNDLGEKTKELPVRTTRLSVATKRQEGQFNQINSSYSALSTQKQTPDKTNLKKRGRPKGTTKKDKVIRSKRRGPRPKHATEEENE